MNNTMADERARGGLYAYLQLLRNLIHFYYTGASCMVPHFASFGAFLSGRSGKYLHTAIGFPSAWPP